MRESERSVTDRLADIYTWMREPDTIEVASLEWLMDWVDRRPVADLAMVAMLIPSQGVSLSQAHHNPERKANGDF